MFEEMSNAGLPAPAFRTTDSSTVVTLYKSAADLENSAFHAANIDLLLYLDKMRNRLGAEKVDDLRIAFTHKQELTTRRVMEILHTSSPTTRRYLQQLEYLGMIERQGTTPSDPNSRWVLHSNETVKEL